MIKLFVVLTVILIWTYALSVLKRARLFAYHFILGSVGLFLMISYLSNPVGISFMAKVVTALTGVIGKLTGNFTALYQQALIYIKNNNDTVIMFVDSECSGVLETAAFTAILAFFPVYRRSEKQLLTIIGFFYILFSNVLRLLVIIYSVYFFGKDSFYIAHSIVGRLVFYMCTIALYYFIFTKAQIVSDILRGTRNE